MIAVLKRGTDENQIKNLELLQAFGAIHPSCPPAFAYDDALYDHICNFIDKLLSSTQFYQLTCRPDEEAAQLAYRTIFKDNTAS